MLVTIGKICKADLPKSSQKDFVFHSLIRSIHSSCSYHFILHRFVKVRKICAQVLEIFDVRQVCHVVLGLKPQTKDEERDIMM